MHIGSEERYASVRVDSANPVSVPLQGSYLGAPVKGFTEAKDTSKGSEIATFQGRKREAERSTNLS